MKTLNHFAKKTTIALALVALTSGSLVTTAHAQQKNDDKTETTDTSVLVGAASGATMGGLMAGPIGAVVGGVFGIMLGNDAVQDSQLEEMEEQFIASQRSLTKMNGELIAWQQKAMLQPVTVIETAPQILPELTTSIQFRTGQSKIEGFYSEQLGLVGDMLNSFEGLSVHVSGYADARGSNEDNRVLSLQRAKAIEAALLVAGVNQQQITVSAMGEQTSTNVSDSASANVEDYFFDRKAIMTIAPSEKILTANH